MRAAIVVLALVLPVFAGCFGEVDVADEAPEPVRGLQLATTQDFFSNATYDADLVDLDRLSRPVFEALAPVEEFVVMSDGTAISNAVYRPDTDEPVPIFINFSPYWGNTAMSKGDAFGRYLVDNFVPRGYAVILSAIRGTGRSDGCFEVASDREVRDMWEIIDHYAKEPWSNGKMAAGGKSYDSTTQNGMIANHPHPALRGVFHVSGITDMYSYTFQNGLMARVDAGVFTTTYSYGRGGEAGCPAFAEGVVFPASTVATGAKTPYWIERDWTRTIGASDWDGSIFFYHGFHDWNVQPSHILPWLDNVPDQIRVKVWLHDDRAPIRGHLYPMRTDWNLTMLRWLDEELKGIDTGFWLESRAELQGSDRLWRAQETWPDRSGLARLPVGGDGLLVEATEHALRYSGAPVVTATVTALGPDAVFVAKLYEEDPDGARTMRNEAALRLIYRDGLDAPSPVVVGVPMTVAVAFYPADDVLPVGHKWIVAFQEAPSRAIALPGQVQAVQVGTASVDIDVRPADEGVLQVQPTRMPCFAC